jgi:hypothetical protein
LGHIERANINHWTMDKVQKPSNSECYTPSSEPFRFGVNSVNCNVFIQKRKKNKMIKNIVVRFQFLALMIMKNVMFLDMALSLQTFEKNLVPPSSGSKDQLSKQDVNSCVYGLLILGF